jgi:ribosomal protein L27
LFALTDGTVAFHKRRGRKLAAVNPS